MGRDGPTNELGPVGSSAPFGVAVLSTNWLDCDSRQTSCSPPSRQVLRLNLQLELELER
jgi:hypothetical protein